MSEYGISPLFLYFILIFLISTRSTCTAPVSTIVINPSKEFISDGQLLNYQGSNI